MSRILCITALISGLAVSAEAQTGTIPTFGTEQPQSGQIPTFGAQQAAPAASPQIPTFGAEPATEAAAAIPSFGDGAVAAPSLSTGNVSASDPVRILALMQEIGLEGTLTVDGVGDPKIESQASESAFSIYFYGCTDNANCTNLQLTAGYDLPNGITLQKLNAWNADKRYSFAYADEEFDPFLNMDISLDFDGIGPENLKDLLALWRFQIEAFEEHIDW